MLSDYIDEAMQHAQYECIEDGTYFATIPGFERLWASGKTEEECRKELREVLEGWILLGVPRHDIQPEIDWEQL
jgi:predicted RNase H-like HicB family nuclease